MVVFLDGHLNEKYFPSRLKTATKTKTRKTNILNNTLKTFSYPCSTSKSLTPCTARTRKKCYGGDNFEIYKRNLKTGFTGIFYEQFFFSIFDRLKNLFFARR